MLFMSEKDLSAFVALDEDEGGPDMVSEPDWYW